MVTTAQKAISGTGLIRPTLSLAFRSGLLDSRITFSRSSIGTDFGNTGAIVQFSSGMPRFGYDPVTLAPLGLLIEEQRTNLFLNSLLNGTNLSSQTVTVAAVQYALSFYGTGTISMTGGFTGSLVGTGSFPTRSVLVFTATAAPLVCTVSGTVQYAQIEATTSNFPGPTSFIPTAGSTVTRSSDTATMTSTNFSSWYNQSSGTFIVQVIPPGDYNQFGMVLEAAASTTANTNFMIKSNAAEGAAGKRWGIGTIVSGGVQASIVIGSDAAAFSSKLAYAYSQNNFIFTVNGALIGIDTSGSVPTVTTLTIGSRTATSPNLWFNGHIGSVVYYPVNIGIAQSQKLTA